MAHRWTSDDDKALLDAVEHLKPQMDKYRKKNKTRAAWDYVAGYLAPRMAVTGNACRHRYQVDLRVPTKSTDIGDTNREPMRERYITQREAAEMVGRTVHTIRNWRRQGLVDTKHKDPEHPGSPPIVTVNAEQVLAVCKKKGTVRGKQKKHNEQQLMFDGARKNRSDETNDNEIMALIRALASKINADAA